MVAVMDFGAQTVGDADVFSVSSTPQVFGTMAFDQSFEVARVEFLAWYSNQVDTHFSVSPPDRGGPKRVFSVCAWLAVPHTAHGLPCRWCKHFGAENDAFSMCAWLVRATGTAHG